MLGTLSKLGSTRKGFLRFVHIEDSPVDAQLDQSVGDLNTKLMTMTWQTFGFLQEAEDVIRSMDPIMMPDPLAEPMNTKDLKVDNSLPFYFYSIHVSHNSDCTVNCETDQFIILFDSGNYSCSI